MAYADPLDASTPDDSEALSNGDDRIRELKRALRERFATLVDDVDANPWTVLKSQLNNNKKLIFPASGWFNASGNTPTRDWHQLTFPAGLQNNVLVVPTILPVGFTMAHVRLRGTNTGSTGVLTAAFWQLSAAGVSTQLANLVTAVGGGAQIIESAVATTVQADELYGFLITVSQSLLSTIALDRVEVDPQ